MEAVAGIALECAAVRRRKMQSGRCCDKVDQPHQALPLAATAARSRSSIGVSIAHTLQHVQISIVCCEVTRVAPCIARVQSRDIHKAEC
jgi:hypothetical protein